VLDRVGGQCHGPAALPLGMTQYPLYRRLGGQQGQSGGVQKISVPDSKSKVKVSHDRLRWPKGFQLG